MTMTSESEKKAPRTPGTAGLETPIVIDAGRRSWGDVRDLKEGTGRLLQDAIESIHQLQQSGEVKANVQPVIFVVTT